MIETNKKLFKAVRLYNEGQKDKSYFTIKGIETQLKTKIGKGKNNHLFPSLERVYRYRFRLFKK